MIATRFLIFISTFCFFAGIGHAQLHIRVNQLGFAPDSPKSAIVFSPAPVPTGFQLINATTNAVVFKGQVRPLTGAWGEFDHHAELDFTSLTAEGSYVIEIGSARSRKFTISRTINDLEDALLEFMRQQRCGYNPLVDAVCHRLDGRTASFTIRSLTIAIIKASVCLRTRRSIMGGEQAVRA